MEMPFFFFFKVLGMVIFSCLNFKYLKRFSFNRLFLVFILKVHFLICSLEFSLVWNGIASDFVFGWAPDGSAPSYCSSAVCVTYFSVLFYFFMYAVEISSFVFFNDFFFCERRTVVPIYFVAFDLYIWAAVKRSWAARACSRVSTSRA